MKQTLVRLLVLAGLLLLGPGACSSFPGCKPFPETPPAPEGVVIVVIDTLRADHVSALGYSRKTTPRIDKLAQEGLLFERAVSASSWTQPAIASLFTSTYPTVHHVTRTPRSGPEMSVLPPGLTTIAEFLSTQGFRSFAVSSHPYVSPLAGFDQGFQEFQVVSSLLEEDEPKKVMDRGLALLERLEPGTRFFLYLHIMGPHFPYQPPPEFKGRFGRDSGKKIERLFSGKTYQEQVDFLSGEAVPLFRKRPELLSALVALYDEEIAFSDQQVGRLADALDERNLLDKTLLIILSDHGEGFLDHGKFGHGNSLFRELTRVLLVFRYPPLGRGIRISTPVSLMDVFPTLVELFRAKPPTRLQGVSLLPVIRGQKRRPVLSELSVMAMARLTDDRYSFIYRPPVKGARKGAPLLDLEEHRWLFNLDKDPREEKNLAEENPELAEKMLMLLMEMERENRRIKIPPAKKKPVSPELEAKLTALGYLRN